MKHWFHSNAVWPPLRVVGFFAIMYGIVIACLWLVGLGPTTGAEDPEITNMRTGLLLGAAGAYAIYRFGRFHPACNSAYAAWLKLSPWNADKPLPLGPIHPVWQDAVVLGGLTAIAVWHARLAPTAILFAFGGVYLGGLTIVLACTRRWWNCLILGFLWPALILPAAQGIPAVLIVIAIIGVVWQGLRASLRAFPEGFPNATPPARSISQPRGDIEIAPSLGAPAHVGWPLTALSPKLKSFSISYLTSACFSTLACWWCYCAISRFHVAPPPELIVPFAMLVALIRLGIYWSGVIAPFNMVGRLVTGRFVIPGFDKIYVTPLAVVVLAVVGALLVRRAGAWYPMTQAAVLSVLIFVLCSGGPTLRSWVLTGQHRFRPPARAVVNKERLRSI